MKKYINLIIVIVSCLLVPTSFAQVKARGINQTFSQNTSLDRPSLYDFLEQFTHSTESNSTAQNKATFFGDKVRYFDLKDRCVSPLLRIIAFSFFAVCFLLPSEPRLLASKILLY